MLTVLIVDDEPNVVDLVRVTLEDERVRVLDAPDGAHAIEALSALQPDLVLLDVNLPDLSGFEICRWIRQDAGLKHTKVVMLTAAAQKEDITRGHAAGADHYLTKPFSPVRLLSLVEELLPHSVLWARS
jgi:twitching motility two-component system response regulator PilH